MGFYPTDSVQEVAQSLALEPLGSGAAELLAGDVEYRLNLILQEAKKFMVHGKRTTLKPEDVEHAMEALNVEVCWHIVFRDLIRRRGIPFRGTNGNERRSPVPQPAQLDGLAEKPPTSSHLAVLNFSPSSFPLDPCLNKPSKPSLSPHPTTPCNTSITYPMMRLTLQPIFTDLFRQVCRMQGASSGKRIGWQLKVFSLLSLRTRLPMPVRAVSLICHPPLQSTDV